MTLETTVTRIRSSLLVGAAMAIMMPYGAELLWASVDATPAPQAPVERVQVVVPEQPSPEVKKKGVEEAGKVPRT